MNSLYRTVGISKQAVYKYQKQQIEMEQKLSELVLDADLIKSEHPGCGVEKLYYTLQPDWLGRDKFIDYFMDLGYRVKRIRNYIRTTVPVHSKYVNLISGMLLNDRNQVWQTDITYYHAGLRFYYITFIIDVYTKKNRRLSRQR